MTIREWLTPGLFDVNVILVALVINWTLINLASNFLEDFHVSDRVQNANYTAAVAMTVIYSVLILLGLAGAMKPQPTLYPNRYDFLLMGNYRALASIIAGLVVGLPAGFYLGNRKTLRWTTAVLAVICEGLIGLSVLLWLLAQE